MTQVQNIITWLSAVEHLIPPPEDMTQVKHWREAAEDLADDCLITDEEHTVASQMLAIYVEQHKTSLARRVLEHRATAASTGPSPAMIAHMNELCERPQVEQRTESWYAQMQRILGASELDDIFATPRVRGLLVMAKANPQPRPPQSLAVFSNRMTAFDWGIRFEPVVKMIYEHMYTAEIKELGRLISSADSRLSASPDGLVYSGPRAGRLIEIKCPVTREPDGTISKKYYTQMQSQLFVTGLTECDFVEAVFTSPYSSPIQRVVGGGEHPATPTYSGQILLIETMNDDFETSYSYVYGPLNHEGDYTPDLRPNQTVVERIPWTLHGWYEQFVRADPAWWSKVKPAVDMFWEDVEKAKRGEFVLPESTRAPRAKKQEMCLIVIKEGS
jgi:hypothetical protein